MAPGFYTTSADGKGIPTAVVLTIHAKGSNGWVYPYQCPPGGPCTAAPIDLGPDTDAAVLELYDAGIRGHSVGVACKIGSLTLPADYAGPQGYFVGEDQVNILLPKSLRGTGNTTILLTVDGQAANPVSLSFR